MERDAIRSKSAEKDTPLMVDYTRKECTGDLVPTDAVDRLSKNFFQSGNEAYNCSLGYRRLADTGRKHMCQFYFFHIQKNVIKIFYYSGSVKLISWIEGEFTPYDREA